MATVTVVSVWIAMTGTFVWRCKSGLNQHRSIYIDHFHVSVRRNKLVLGLMWVFIHICVLAVQRDRLWGHSQDRGYGVMLVYIQQGDNLFIIFVVCWLVEEFASGWKGMATAKFTTKWRRRKKWLQRSKHSEEKRRQWLQFLTLDFTLPPKS